MRSQTNRSVGEKIIAVSSTSVEKKAKALIVPLAVVSVYRPSPTFFLSLAAYLAFVVHTRMNQLGKRGPVCPDFLCSEGYHVSHLSVWLLVFSLVIQTFLAGTKLSTIPIISLFLLPTLVKCEFWVCDWQYCHETPHYLMQKNGIFCNVWCCN